MRIALVQQYAGLDRNENLDRGILALRNAADAGAEIVCFAELAFERFYPQYRAEGAVGDRAETIPGPMTDAFSDLARELGVVVVLNLFEREGDRCFDSSPVIDADGSLLGVTRMIHITQYESPSILTRAREPDRNRSRTSAHIVVHGVEIP